MKSDFPQEAEDGCGLQFAGFEREVRRTQRSPVSLAQASSLHSDCGWQRWGQCSASPLRSGTAVHPAASPHASPLVLARKI